MSFLWFLIVGLVAGWLAGTLVKGGGFGILGSNRNSNHTYSAIV